MAEWWQSPAYLQRQAGGEVVTPGLVDWGGLINAFNAPSNERVGRLPTGPSPAPSSKSVMGSYNASPAGMVNAKQERYGTPTIYSAATRMEDASPALPKLSVAGYGAGNVGARDYGGGTVSGGGFVNQPAGYRGPSPYAEHLPPIPAGLPLNAPLATARAGLGASARLGGSASLSGGSGKGPLQLQFEVMSDTAGQNMADSAGRVIVTPSGKTYSPRQGAGNPRTLPQVAPSDMRGAAQSKQGGWMSLLGGMLNGGGQAPSGSPAIGSASSQGGAMVVSPGTSTGSTLSSMGFSDGALVPAATIRNLSARGYI